MIYPEAMKKLPPPLLEDGVPSTRKLVYLWVKENPGRHSARSLQAALGVDVDTALSDLVRDGLLIEEVPQVGPQPGHYRAAPLRGSPSDRGDRFTGILNVPDR